MGDFMNWIVVVGVLATIIQTVVYLAVTFRPTETALFSDHAAPIQVPNRIRLYFAGMGLLTLISWAAIGFDYFTRPPLAPAVLIDYGFDGNNQFHGIARLRHWPDFEHYKAILITRTAFADRDRMTDTWIAKSVPYTINGPEIVMVAINKTTMRFAANQGNFIEYNFAVIPPDISPDQILTLGDVARLGGKILAENGQGGIPGGPLPDVPAAPPKHD